MHCAVLVTSSTLLILFMLALIGCSSSVGTSSHGGNSSTSNMGSYTVDMTNKVITYTPPTNLVDSGISVSVSSVYATFTTTSVGLPSPLYVAFSSLHSGTFSLDISAQSPNFNATDKGTYTCVVTAVLSDANNVTVGTTTTVVLSGGTNLTPISPPGTPF